MTTLRDKAPSFLLGAHQMSLTVLYTALSAAFMIIVFMPFSDNPWLDMDITSAMGHVTLFYGLCLAYLIMSRLILFALAERVRFWHYIAWVISEVVVISSFYAFLTLAADSKGIISADGLPFVILALRSVGYCVLAVLLPTVVAGMYYDIRYKDNIIRMIDYGSVVSDEQVAGPAENKITLFDNKGVLKLSVSETNLLYIESDDNYVKVWYQDQSGTIKQYMLRCRLKTIEESFIESNLLRCHRKYIVNMMRVDMLRKEKEGYVLVMDNEALAPIPVTKTYEENILRRFNERV